MVFGCCFEPDLAEQTVENDIVSNFPSGKRLQKTAGNALTEAPVQSAQQQPSSGNNVTSE
jgi:hypothetical protein